jgi:hypothetical protein
VLHSTCLYSCPVHVSADRGSACDVVLDDGSRHGWDALLLATGAEFSDRKTFLNFSCSLLPSLHIMTSSPMRRLECITFCSKPGAIMPR